MTYCSCNSVATCANASRSLESSSTLKTTPPDLSARSFKYLSATDYIRSSISVTGSPPCRPRLSGSDLDFFESLPGVGLRGGGGGGRPPGDPGSRRRVFFKISAAVGRPRGPVLLGSAGGAPALGSSLGKVGSVVPPCSLRSTSRVGNGGASL